MCVQVQAPIDIRVQEAKRENADLENLRHKIASRDDDVIELRKQLKMKVSQPSLLLLLLHVACIPVMTS